MALTVLTDVQIFNQALLRLGITSGLVTAVDGSDTSKFGKIANPLYQLTRDEELRVNDWAKLRKRVQLTEAYIIDTACSWTAGSDTLSVTTTTGIVAGWVIGSEIIRGNPPATPPAGIPAGTTVKAILTSTTLQMSAAATANGSGQCVFQVDNETGYWFAYILPDDALRLTDVYAVYPASAYLWPYERRETLSYPFINEAGYIYTNLFTEEGAAIAEYIYEPADGTPPFSSDFAESLILRLAGKLCMPATKDFNLKKDVNAEYVAVMTRAFGTSNRTSQEAHAGEGWWRP